MKEVAILITVHNRREITLRGLETLRKAINQMDKKEYHYDTFLVDDGSTDGTYESVSKKFPEVYLYKGDGNLFWVHGMQLAWKKAVETKDYDYFLWFNDDNELFEKALVIMFASSNENPNCVICGAFCDKAGNPTYCGRKKKYELLEPNGKCQEIDRMHGNFVLIPKEIYKKTGMMDIRFIHNFGDFDYGFKVQKAGFSILLVPEYIGFNEFHDDELMDHLHEMHLMKRLKLLYHPQYHPKYSFYFHKKHLGLAIAIKNYVNQYLFILFPSYKDFFKYIHELRWGKKNYR